MATATYGLPSGSQQSSSDLSEPPDFTEEEIAEFTATMAPRTRSQSESNGQAKSTSDSTLPLKRSVNDGPATKEDEKDEVVAEIEVAPRSSRRRVPSKRAQVTFAQPASSATPATKRPKTSARKWTPEYVTQSKQSPLVNKDLRALLLHPQAWDVLGDEDKKELLALFPDTRHILNANTPDARPNIMSLQNDDNFRHDTEEYVSNLKAGMHDPAWLQDAWAAHEARASGQFDEYYIRKLEVDWKTTIPDELKPENLRSVPAAEPKKGAESETQAESTQVSAAAKGSEVVESNTEADGGDGVEDVVMGSSTDGSAASVTEDLQKVSVANVHETVGGNPDKDSTAAVVD
ncbi:hypothetical protein INS49_014593 [Diaporthe citri]|uniref:uncharacterized protein n=1 Tax=Diaporthe citri TaxID=83186 RepID=UPI001C7EC2E4|nr:uncharacterized protein INS49_014593 [Diaporthe citri]KAG6356719.1 hypothetical protein INS49_014593 [Diaporthe citri]